MSGIKTTEKPLPTHKTPVEENVLEMLRPMLHVVQAAKAFRDADLNRKAASGFSRTEFNKVRYQKAKAALAEAVDKLNASKATQADDTCDQ